MSIIRILWWIFWPGWGVGNLFFVLVSLFWAAWPSGGGFVLCLFCSPFWVPFFILPVYVLEPSFWVSFSIYLLFIDQKKKKFVIAFS